MRKYLCENCHINFNISTDKGIEEELGYLLDNPVCPLCSSSNDVEETA